MTFDTRFTWEKLCLELKLLRTEDFGSLVPLCIGINSILWPKENLDSTIRQVQFLGFHLVKTCEDLDEPQRWEALRRFVFEEKKFHIASARLPDWTDDLILMKPVLDDREGHPLPIVFLLLYLAHFLDLPMALLQARHHYLFKWVRSGKTVYLDLTNEGRALTDEELIQVLNRSSSSLEIWSAKQLMTQYLELLLRTFETNQSLTHLHTTLNLMLQMDDTNIAALGQRALLRQRLGYDRDALNDLKRYFSFVDPDQAPFELKQAWMELEAIPPEPPARAPTDVLH